jgi:hypothetical protein
MKGAIMSRKPSIPDAALDRHIAILGKTGSGKTYTAKGIVERLLDEGRQICILDPTAAWWGLRLAANGKSKGHDVVLLGGKRGDVPMHERSGDAVARLVTQQRANVVIDTSGMTVGEYTRWFIAFAGTLYTTIESPLHLIIDEAHQFMPQGGGGKSDVDTGRMLHAGNRLMSGGRSLGVRGMMITQRPAKLHKDSLTCADTLIAMRVIAPQDRKAVKDWIDGCGDPDQGKAILDSLAQLKCGEGWAWYPEAEYLKLTRFPKIATYDSSATPEHGSGGGPAVSSIDLDDVKAALAEAVAEAEANDPKLLRQRIAELERQAKQADKPPEVVADPKAIEAAVASRDRHWQSEIDKLVASRNELLGLLNRIETLAHVNGEPVKLADPPTIKATPRQVAAAKPKQPARVAGGSPTNLPTGEAKILTALIQFPDGLDRSQLTVLTGYKRRTRDTYLQRLGGRGFVDQRGDKMFATDAGVITMPSVDPLPTGQELRDHWLSKLPTGESAILRELINAYPHDLTRDEITDATGYKRRTRDTYIQRMRSKQIIRVDGGSIYAADTLF